MASPPARARALCPFMLALLAGTAATLSWPTPSVWPLIFIVPGLLTAAATGLPSRRRFAVGWVGGLVAFGATFHWVAFTARAMSAMSPTLALIVLFLFAAFHACMWGLFTLAAPLLLERTGRLRLLVITAWWCLLEWLFPFVFPIFLGYAFFRVPVLLQVSDLTGVYGLTALIVLVSHAILVAFRRAKAGAPAWRAAVPAVVALAVVLGYGAWRLHTLATGTATLRVALVQPNQTLAEKLSNDPQVRYGMLQRALTATHTLAPRSVAAVVWPEGAFPFYLPDFDGPAAAAPPPGQVDLRERGRAEIRALVDKLQAPLILGSLRKQDGRTRNAVARIAPGAAPTEIYDKQVLVPFGEYLPLSDTFPWLKNRIKGVSDLAAGDRHRAFAMDVSADGRAPVRALVSVCYEALLPAFVHEGFATVGADVPLLLNVTSDLWFGENREPALHLMAQVHRTVEHRVSLVRATTTGISALVDFRGHILAESPIYEEALIVGDVPYRTGTFSFYRACGDVFLGVLLAAAAVVVFLTWLRARRNRARAAVSEAA